MFMFMGNTHRLGLITPSGLHVLRCGCSLSSGSHLDRHMGVDDINTRTSGSYSYNLVLAPAEGSNVNTDRNWFGRFVL